MAENAKRTPTGGRRRAVVAAVRPAWTAKAGMALAAALITSGAVGVGVLGQTATPEVADDLGAVVSLQGSTPTVDAERDEVVSRSDNREAADPAKKARLAPSKPKAETQSEKLSASDPKSIARALLGDYGFSASQFGCLESLWEKESGWNPSAQNPYSGAYGIPQSLPGSKMASVGADWRTNPVTQIKWGLEYIQGRYGSPCGAWGHSQSRGWY